jgi:hypothetical protein
MSAAEKNSSPFVLRIGNFGAHQHPTRIRIDHRADGGNPFFKDFLALLFGLIVCLGCRFG